MSLVNRAASHGLVTATAIPSTTPGDDAPFEEPPRRARASCAASAPRYRPTMACAAMASASSERARNSRICIATWCAATSSSPNRAAMAVAVSRVTSSAPVRTISRLPTDALARMPVGRARNDASERRAAAADHHQEGDGGAVLRGDRAPCRSGDAEIEDVDQRRARGAGSRCSTATAITSVVRVSCMPRR